MAVVSAGDLIAFDMVVEAPSREIPRLAVVFADWVERLCRG
jgi:hypothetical protein